MAVTPEAVSDHESVTSAPSADWPTARQTGLAPTTLPSKAPSAYVKVATAPAVESAAVAVAGAHGAHFEKRSAVDVGSAEQFVK